MKDLKEIAIAIVPVVVGLIVYNTVWPMVRSFFGIGQS